ncbi:MAG: dephospho-CoA kinase [Parachlamydiaceae bacterium]|nr:dephospho-CoA kinase [Parachlamydiaceae bacterium]
MIMRKIAVTGTLSSGKSTVCQLFKELGAYVVSADEIVHQLLVSGTKIGQQVIDIFGDEILTNGQIDRSKIAKKAFRDPVLLQALEKLIHPQVRNQIEREYQCCTIATYPLFVAEIPLLFETNWDVDYPVTIAVIAKPELCKQRHEKNKNISNESDYQQRSKRQLGADEKACKATYVIYNNGSLEMLRANVANIFELLTPNTGV